MLDADDSYWDDELGAWVTADGAGVFNEETQAWEYGELVEPLTADEEAAVLADNAPLADADEALRQLALDLFRLVPPREQAVDETWVPPPPPPLPAPGEDDGDGDDAPPPPPPPPPTTTKSKKKATAAATTPTAAAGSGQSTTLSASGKKK